MNRLKARSRIKVQNAPWWWARLTLSCCRESRSLKRWANWSLAQLGQPAGRGGPLSPPAHCTRTGPPFGGKQGFFSPPRPGRKFCAENADGGGSSAIFVADDGCTGLGYAKILGSNYMINMKCFSPQTEIRKHLFVKTLKSVSLWNFSFILKKSWNSLQKVIKTVLQ